MPKRNGDIFKMAKLATKGAVSKPAAKTTLAKPAAKGAAAKPVKGALAKPAAKAPKEPTFKDGDVVKFLGYKDREENFEPLFEEGERLVIVSKQKDGDTGAVFYAAVKEEDHEAYKATPDDVNGDQVFAAEIEKAEKLPDDPFKMQLVTDAKLDELLAEHDGDALETAKSLQEDIARGEFYLGGALQNLYANRAYLEYGEGEGDANSYADDKNDDNTVVKMSGWDKFTRENFNESGRKCFDLLTTYRSFAPLLDAERMEAIATNRKIGYVKLAAAKNIVTKANIDEIIELAETSNVKDFKEAIKTDYAAEGGEARSGGTGKSAGVKRTRITVAFYEDQGAGVDYVLTQAAKEFGVEKDNLNVILERIIMDWAVQNLGETATKKARAEKKKVLKNLKGAGVDTKSRLEDDAALDEYLSRHEEGEEAEATA